MKYTTQVQRKVYMETKTADGRDLSREEFRTIPGFDKYEITKDGDVRNINSGKLLSETQNKTTGAWSYCLWKADGKTTHRNWERLMWLAYPEIEEQAKEEAAKKAEESRAKPYKVMKHKTDVCPLNHKYTPANTSLGKNGSRTCKTCKRYKAKIRRDKLKAEKENAA